MKILFILIAISSINSMDKPPFCSDKVRADLEALTASQYVLDEHDKIRKCDVCAKPAVFFTWAAEDVCSYCKLHTPTDRKEDDQSEEHIR